MNRGYAERLRRIGASRNRRAQSREYARNLARPAMSAEFSPESLRHTGVLGELRRLRRPEPNSHLWTRWGEMSFPTRPIFKSWTYKGMHLRV